MSICANKYAFKLLYKLSDFHGTVTLIYQPVTILDSSMNM